MDEFLPEHTRIEYHTRSGVNVMRLSCVLVCVFEGDAVTGMPCAELARRVRVVIEEKIINRVLDAAAAPIKSRFNERFNARSVRIASFKPL